MIYGRFLTDVRHQFGIPFFVDAVFLLVRHMSVNIGQVGAFVMRQHQPQTVVPAVDIAPVVFNAAVGVENKTAFGIGNQQPASFESGDFAFTDVTLGQFACRVTGNELAGFSSNVLPRSPCLSVKRTDCPRRVICPEDKFTSSWHRRLF